MIYIDLKLNKKNYYKSIFKPNDIGFVFKTSHPLTNVSFIVLLYLTEILLYRQLLQHL